jgi:hypothetical protein
LTNSWRENGLGTNWLSGTGSSAEKSNGHKTFRLKFANAKRPNTCKELHYVLPDALFFQIRRKTFRNRADEKKSDVKRFVLEFVTKNPA